MFCNRCNCGRQTGNRAQRTAQRKKIDNRVARAREKKHTAPRVVREIYAAIVCNSFAPRKRAWNFID